MGTLQDGELKKPTAQRDAALHSNVLMSLMSFGAPEGTGIELMAVFVIFNKSYKSGNNTGYSHAHNDNAHLKQMFILFTILDKKPVGIVLNSKLKPMEMLLGLAGI